MGAYGPTQETALHLQSALTFLFLFLTQHRASLCNKRSMFYVNHFPVESLIINADSSKGRNPWHLASRTVNENVIKKANLQTMKWPDCLFLFFFPVLPLCTFPSSQSFFASSHSFTWKGCQFLANRSYLSGGTN